MRGNGESQGDLSQFSRADFLSDAQNVYDYFRQQLANETAIGVVGSSFGSYTAILLTKERPVYCLSLRVPASYPDTGFDDALLPQIDAPSLAPWRRQVMKPEDNRAFQALHDFTGDVQIVEAGADEVVPSQAPQNYAHAIGDPARLSYATMENAPHSLINQSLQAEYEQILTSWAEQLKLPNA